MPEHLNQGLELSDFKVGPGRFPWQMIQSHVTAFLGLPRVVTLPPGFKLYKLTKGNAPEDPRFGVTPWWSAVEPYDLDEEGAFGRYEQAHLNGIDMSSMARYMSAVIITWNDLDNYVEVKTNCTIDCFWGKFAPQPISEKPPGDDAALIARLGKTTSSGYSDAVLPWDLGPLVSWQFYVPGLRNNHLDKGATRDICINARDMKALGEHFGRDLGGPDPRRANMPSPKEFYDSTSVGMLHTRHQCLKEMDSSLTQYRNGGGDLALTQFYSWGQKYLRDGMGEPLRIKDKVRDYMQLAKNLLHL